MTKEILILRADGSAEPFAAKVTLKSLQAAVGGKIEHVRVLDRIEDGRFVYTSMYVNDEGLLLGLPRNSTATEVYQRNIRAQYPKSQQPFKEANARFNKEHESSGVTVIDGTPASAKASGYDDDPWICGDVVLFKGYTCQEADDLYEGAA